MNAIAAQSETDIADAGIDAAIAAACDRVAPLWPLKHWVAVNPFLGFADQSFEATCATMRRVARVDMLMPRGFYAAAIADGSIGDADLGAADAAALRAAATRPPTGARPRAVVATVAEVLDRLARGDRQASRTAFMVDEIARWCATWFDEGQAAWKSPWRDLKPYAAWRAAMRLDRNAETMGIAGFRRSVAALPDDATAAIAHIVAALGIPASARVDYLHRALFDIGGWAAYARYRVWDNGLYGRADDTLAELLAIRLAWGYALFQERRDPEFRAAWARAMADAATMAPGDDADPDSDPDLAIDLALHAAYERGYQRRLLARLTPAFAAPAPAPLERPALQAAFCIDVRSEVYRRALETVCPGAKTIGFAGFFGFPIEYVPIGQQRGGAQCPVLLTPNVVVREHVCHANDDEATEVLGLRLLRRRAARAWKAFKLSAVSSFTFVETMGLGFAAKIAGDSLGLTRPVPHPHLDGLDAAVARNVGPTLEPRLVAGRPTGFEPAARLAMAEAVLRAMSMSGHDVPGHFARLVLLTGHGSSTTNNPHATGLDCGACGGHTGEANARVAALILNDPDVRSGLVAKGIVIPADTWFLGCLHDTTTDDVRLFDEADVPPSLRADLPQLKAWLDAAGARARAERARLLALTPGAPVDAAVRGRARDWSQVRPEWGLAGNAAFIAAPRARTRGVDLGGRAFLHDYDWRADAGFKVLELIMTAPMVVASWINLQYFGSVVNNRAFGSGNKTLHNVVGALGVLEGNAGDLRAGLPWQSVHDGRRLIHEPLRLNVFVEAPAEELNRVIAAQDGVRRLVDNGWVHLHRIADDGSVERYVGGLRWDAA